MRHVRLADPHPLNIYIPVDPNKDLWFAQISLAKKDQWILFRGGFEHTAQLFSGAAFLEAYNLTRIAKLLGIARIPASYTHIKNIENIKNIKNIENNTYF